MRPTNPDPQLDPQTNLRFFRNGLEAKRKTIYRNDVFTGLQADHFGNDGNALEWGANPLGDAKAYKKPPIGWLFCFSHFQRHEAIGFDYVTSSELLYARSRWQW
jgi:hypothetical protein